MGLVEEQGTLFLLEGQNETRERQSEHMSGKGNECPLQNQARSGFQLGRMKEGAREHSRSFRSTHDLCDRGLAKSNSLKFRGLAKSNTKQNSSELRRELHNQCRDHQMKPIYIVALFLESTLTILINHFTGNFLKKIPSLAVQYKEIIQNMRRYL